MREAVQRIYRERKALTASLKVRKPENSKLFIVDNVIGRRFSGGQARCSPCLHRTPFYRICLFAHLQSKQHVGLIGAPRHHHSWIFVHLRSLGPDAV